MPDKRDKDLRALMRQAARDFTLADMSHPSTPDREERKEAARALLRDTEAKLKARRLARDKAPQSRSEAKRVELLKAQADRRAKINRNKN